MQSTAPTLPLNYVPPVYPDEMEQALRLIAHATAPSHDDGAFHETAYELASAILKRLDARRAYEGGVYETHQ